MFIRQLLHLGRKRVIFIIGEYHTCKAIKVKAVFASLHAEIYNFLMVVTVLGKKCLF